MNIKTILLRISFLLGAVLDGFIIIPMLFPNIGSIMFGLTGFNPGVEYKYAMATGASLMLGWTFLLIWGYIKPIERQGIIMITVFPVLIGLFLAGVYAVKVNFISLNKILPMYIIQLFLIIFFTFSYFFPSGSKNNYKKDKEKDFFFEKKYKN